MPKHLLVRREPRLLKVMMKMAAVRVEKERKAKRGKRERKERRRRNRLSDIYCFIVL